MPFGACLNSVLEQVRGTTQRVCLSWQALHIQELEIKKILIRSFCPSFCQLKIVPCSIFKFFDQSKFSESPKIETPPIP